MNCRPSTHPLPEPPGSDVEGPVSAEVERCELREEPIAGEGEAHHVTPLAAELAEIKSSILTAIKKRERLPQPLFWHLFSQRLEKVRKAKERDRVLSALFGEEAGSNECDG